jgi:predicted RNA-binding protein with PIN domain
MKKYFSSHNNVARPSIVIVLSLIIILLSSIVAIISSAQISYAQDSGNTAAAAAAIYNNNVIVNNISDNVGDSVYAQIAAYKDNVYMVWQDNIFGNSERNYDILFKLSTDGGSTFSKPINISNNTGLSEHPQIAAYGNNVYVVWADDTSITDREILFTKSTDGGSTFSKPINISNNTGDSYNQEITVLGNNVYVVWYDYQDSSSGNKSSSSIFFKSSTDGGATFSSIKNLGTNEGALLLSSSSYPKVATYKNNVYVVWDLYTDNSVDNKNIKNNNSNNSSIFFTKSIDNGDNFGEVIRLNYNEKSGESQIAAYENNVYVVWGSSSVSPSPSPSPTSNSKNNNSNNSSIFFTKSIDNGDNFIRPLLITDKYKDLINVEVVEYTNTLYISWDGSSIINTNNNSSRMENDDGEIFVTKSTDKGTTFIDAKNLSNNYGVSECPSIAISGNNRYLVWEDLTPGNHEILFSKIML